MPYLVKEELKSVIRMYQLDAIVNGDDTIIDEAIAKAVEKAGNILTPNDKKSKYDGRVLYDVPAIFAAIGEARNLLVLGYVKTFAIYFLAELCNVGSDYKDVQDRYDRAEEDLKKLASGEQTSGTLPRLAVDPEPDRLPFGFGSRPKFNHNYYSIDDEDFNK